MIEVVLLLQDDAEVDQSIDVPGSVFNRAFEPLPGRLKIIRIQTKHAEVVHRIGASGRQIERRFKPLPGRRRISAAAQGLPQVEVNIRIARVEFEIGRAHV